MKKYKYCIIIMIISLNYSCYKNKKMDSLENNSIVAKYFNPDEVVELKALLTTFDDIILKKSPESHKLDIAYRDFFNKLKNVKSADEHIPIYALDYSKFENQLSPKLSDEVWKYSKVFNTKRKFIFEEIDLNFTGKYIMFLKEISLENEILKKYYSNLLSSGSIAAPDLVNNFVHNSKYLNLDKESVRLIIAIHYITLNNILIVNN